MKISEYLRGIADLAAHHQKCERGCSKDDRTYYQTALSNLADKLRRVSVRLPPKMARALQAQAHSAEAYGKIISDDQYDEVGTLTFWSEMGAIESLARNCLARARTRKENISLSNRTVEEKEPEKEVQDAIRRSLESIEDLKPIEKFVSKLKEFYLVLFFAFQNDGLIEQGHQPVIMDGDIEDVTQFYADQIQSILDQSVENRYPALYPIWEHFLNVNALNPEGSLEILDTLIGTVTDEGSESECVGDVTRKEFASIKDAIQQSDLGGLKQLMMSCPMGNLPMNQRVELVEMAIDLPSLSIIQLFSECDWFNDMSGDAFNRVADYAKEKRREGHRAIILESSGYMIEKSFVEFDFRN